MIISFLLVISKVGLALNVRGIHTGPVLPFVQLLKPECPDFPPTSLQIGPDAATWPIHLAGLDLHTQKALDYRTEPLGQEK